jgi:hypothetical protein
MSEVAAVNLHGHGDLNNDRPLETLDAAELRAEHQKMKSQWEAMMALYQRDYEAPQREQQKVQVRERVRQNLMDQYGIYDSLDDGKLDKFISDNVDREQRLAAYEQARVNRSLDDAREKYGAADFDAVFQRVMEMRQTPTSLALVQEIQNSSNPGEALMSMHGSDIVEMLRSPPPFQNQSASRPRQPLQRKGRPGGHIGHDLLGGWGDSEVESDVMDSVWE